MGECCQFLDEWDTKKKEVLGKVNVMGKHSNVCSADVKCILETKKAMDINLTRMESLNIKTQTKIRISTTY